MHKAEKTFLLSSLLALLLLTFNIPGSTILWVASLSALAFLYYFFGIALFNQIPLQKILKKESYKGISKRRIAASLAFGWTLAILSIGIMFKLLFLPGAMFQLFLGFSLGLAGLLITSFFYHESKQDLFKGIWMRLIPAILIVYILVNIPTLSLAKILEPENVELHEQIEARNEQ